MSSIQQQQWQQWQQQQQWQHINSLNHYAECLRPLPIIIKQNSCLNLNIILSISSKLPLVSVHVVAYNKNEQTVWTCWDLCWTGCWCTGLYIHIHVCSALWFIGDLYSLVLTRQWFLGTQPTCSQSLLHTYSKTSLTNLG